MSQRGTAQGASSIRRLVEIPAVLFLVVVVAMQSLSSEDIRFWDETVTLSNGLNVESQGWPTWSQGATYIDLYWLLGTFLSDSITIYFTMRVISAVALVLGVWLATRLLAGPAIAWTLAALAAALPITYVWPGVAGPAAGLVVVAIAVAIRWRSPVALGVASGLLWLAAGSRAEFTLSAIAGSFLAALWILWLLARHRQPVGGWLWSVISTITGAIVVPILLFLRHGSPLEGWNRSFAAFGQHYELRFALPGDDAWQISGNVLETTFPGATSVTEALLVNPGAFGLHVLQNILLLPLSLGGHVTGMEPGSLLEPTIAKAMAFVVVASLAVSIVVDPRRAFGRCRSLSRGIWVPGRKIATILMGVILLNILVTVVTIYPRPHYLLVPTMLLLVLVGVLLAHVGDRRFQRWFLTGLVAMLFIVYAVLATIHFTERLSNPPPYASSLLLLQTSDNQWYLLAADKPVEPYVSNLTTVVPNVEGAETFDQFLEANKINVALVLPLMGLEPYAQLPGFAEFYNDPASSGFVQVVPESPFWVRLELVSAE